MPARADRWIIVNRWEDFQHYKDRDPKWIKNYVRLLYDDDYMSLSPAQRGVLHGLWMMYAACGGTLTFRRARAHLAQTPHESRTFSAHVESLNHAGFIHFSASKPLALARAGARSRELEKEKYLTRGFSQLATTASESTNEQPLDLTIELREMP